MYMYIPATTDTLTGPLCFSGQMNGCTPSKSVAPTVGPSACAGQVSTCTPPKSVQPTVRPHFWPLCRLPLYAPL